MFEGVLDQFAAVTRRLLTLGSSELIALLAVLVSIAVFLVTRRVDQKRDVGAIRPILVFEYQGEGWQIRNVGTGPAMDVIFTRLNGALVHDHVRLPAMAREAAFPLRFAQHDNLHRFAVTYRDIEGRPYSSDSENDVSRTYEGFIVERPSAVTQWWKLPASDY